MMTKILIQQKSSCNDDCNICEFRKENEVLSEKVQSYQSILENIEKSNSLKQFGNDVSRALTQCHPIYNYIYENAKENQNIRKVFFYEEDNVRNLLFVIDQCNFDRKREISNWMFKIMQIFNRSLFDFMTISIEELEEIDVEEEGYDLLYIGDIINA